MTEIDHILECTAELIPAPRLQALHAAQLLTEAELGRVEDAIADAIAVMEVTPELPASDSYVGAVLKLLAFSKKIVGDVSFARQLRRHFV